MKAPCPRTVTDCWNWFASRTDTRLLGASKISIHGAFSRARLEAQCADIKEPRFMNIRSIVGAACAGIAISTAMTAAAHGTSETVALNFQHAIPNIPGKSLTAVVVDYAPGGASPAHTHAKSAFIYAYVLSGEIESQVNDGPRRVFHAGESFYETPGSLHAVSRNASKTEPAKLLAVFVV